MKKILIILTLMIGFSATAQDDFIKRFKFKTSASASFQDRNHLFSEDLNHCSGNLADASAEEVFTWNSSTGVLSRNGNALGQPITGRRVFGLNNTFARTYNEVNVISNRGITRQRLTYNADTNTWE